ncbi:MAG: hypothetical protein LUQ37_10005 [Methanoregulaceae archaeon]|jgi:hypothetical protein|nr:hypothetical protein [Methanoregulaceae archaeon]
MPKTKKANFKIISILKSRGKVIRENDESGDCFFDTTFDRQTTTFIDGVEYWINFTRAETDRKANTIRIWYTLADPTGRVIENKSGTPVTRDPLEV